jgi:hypothetical protein
MVTHLRRPALLSITALLAVLLVACGGGDAAQTADDAADDDAAQTADDAGDGGHGDDHAAQE